jgi:ComF family protein
MECQEIYAYSAQMVCQALGVRAASAGKISCHKMTMLAFAIIVVFKYEYPIDHCIGRLKFKRELAYAKVLGKLLLPRLEQYYSKHAKPGAIIPVPLHRKRLRERGFNQSLEIAKELTKGLKIPIDRYSCKRRKHTQPQTTLPIRERNQNIKRAFIVKRPIKYKHVAVLDDVITTGNTINEFCQMLRENGVEKIDVWCCAKTQLRV